MWRQLLCLSMVCISVMAQDKPDERIDKPPKITIPATDRLQFASNKDTVILHCKAEGEPQPLYKWKWMKKGTDKWDAVEPLANSITYNSKNGDLQITRFNQDFEGKYLCVAFATVYNPVKQEAASFSPIITLGFRFLDDFTDKGEDDVTYAGEEYDYLKLECTGQGANAGNPYYSWYRGGNQLQENRYFVDTKGNLHVSYLKVSDMNRVDDPYKCGMGGDDFNGIVWQQKSNLIQVKKSDSTQKATPPVLIYDNSGVVATVGGDVILECMFKGYDPVEPHIPVITWYDSEFKEINRNKAVQSPMHKRFTVQMNDFANGRRLHITNVMEKDIGTFYCSANNTAGKVEKQPVELKVVSPPIFDDAEKDAPHDVIRYEGVDFTYNCNARSAKGDPDVVETPNWYINGMEAGTNLNPSKHILSGDKKSLTIRHLEKKTDTVCVQCMVKNTHGLSLKDGCITVLLPIVITYPESGNISKVVKYGDIVDMTITATTDPTQELQWEWQFKNEIYKVSPSWMNYNPDTKAAYINTSMLTEEEFEKMAGTYIRKIWHAYQTEYAYINLYLDDPPPAPIVQTASFDMWILGLIIGIIFLIVVVIIIIFIICRKQQEGDYNVDKKEHGAGLDPEKELKNKGFDDYSRPDYADYDYPDRKPRGDLEYDDVPIGGDDESLGEYGDEATYFNEDGSFIGIYQKKEQPTKNYHASESTI